MREITSSTAATFYVPAPSPTDPKDLPRHIDDELRKVRAAIEALAAGHLDRTYAEPPKLKDGDIRYADGVTWKPNGTGGVGIWYYNKDTALWVQLG